MLGSGSSSDDLVDELLLDHCWRRFRVDTINAGRQGTSTHCLLPSAGAPACDTDSMPQPATPLDIRDTCAASRRGSDSAVEVAAAAAAAQHSCARAEVLDVRPVSLLRNSYLGDWNLGGAWGLGLCRTLYEFEAHCGVDFKHRRSSDHARNGGFSSTSFM